jgi:transposase
VVETGRRRRWSEDEKLKIVLESLQAPRQVTAAARRYGISRSLLLRWRQLFRPVPKDATEGLRGNEGGPGIGAALGLGGSAGSGAIEIEFAAGARMRITGAVDVATLKAVVAALAEGRPR